MFKKSHPYAGGFPNLEDGEFLIFGAKQLIAY
jgi:hypothetical protein